jgi:ribosomal protein S18 acetylase RimI-like enzyme
MKEGKFSIPMTISNYNQQHPPSPEERKNIIQFLFKHLEEYGDPEEDIEKCITYSLGEEGKAGGFILTAHQDNELACAVVINKTGMNGYIPGHILVYIATHHNFRGKGIGKKMMLEALKIANGDMALHVEPNNPAKRLYEQLGFTNKYLEMRYKKKN